MQNKSEHQHIRISDETIIDLYWLRDERAIEETDVKYGKFLFRIAYNILHDRLDCEECQNDTYLGIWKAIPPTRPAKFPAFIAQIMRRISINRYKEKANKKRIPSELTVSLDELDNIISDSETVDNEYTALEIGQLISTWIENLPKKQQYIFIERFYMIESVENIADDLGMGLSTVYKEINKLKCDLKLYLESNGVNI